MAIGSKNDRSYFRATGRLQKALIAAAAVVSLSVTGCSGAGPSGSGTTLTTASASHVAADLHGKRYCEVLLVHVTGGIWSADVYNSYPLNTCPAAAWASLDASALAHQYGAVAALLNGPRFWAMDSITKVGADHLEKRAFGSIEMYRDATVVLGTSVASAQVPYSVHVVNRQASFRFVAGQRIYELTDPSGGRWVMQSWSQIRDTSLTEADLADLGPRLALPAGWTYSSRVLTAPLVVATAGHPARVLQDPLADSYSHETSS